MNLPKIDPDDWSYFNYGDRTAWLEAVPIAVRLLVLYERTAERLDLALARNQHTETFCDLCQQVLRGKTIAQAKTAELLSSTRTALHTARDHLQDQRKIAEAEYIFEAVSALAAAVDGAAGTYWSHYSELGEFLFGEEDTITHADNALRCLFECCQYPEEGIKRMDVRAEEEEAAQLELVTEIVAFSHNKKLDWAHKPVRAYQIWREYHYDRFRQSK